MHSLALIKDMYGHLEWGDACIWQAVMATPTAVADKTVQDRLFHIHNTQRAFLQVWRGETIERFKADSFATMEALYDWIRPYYTEVGSFLENLEAGQLEAPTPLPWAHFFSRRSGREVDMTSLGDTLMQVACHSIHHRAQINLQLRAHGAEPPAIDYIVWMWSGRPVPAWPHAV